MATEKPNEKPRFFGCAWDDGITAGRAGKVPDWKKVIVTLKDGDKIVLT